ncbi:hypothetical protein M405DRAFT_812664 [Rhizopogon salebrosus TDB-379]|nr:hypothetical protein M405DRAFT_812664 [Rhizopogon salebrosus TDB-379]
MSTNGDKKEALQLENGDFGPGSAPVDYQHPRPSIASRLLEVFGISVIGLLLFTVFSRRRFDIARDVSELSTGLNVEPDYPCPSDGVVLRCIRFADWDAYYDSPSWAHQYPFGSESLFSLPVDSGTLYLVSRGAYQHGTVTLEQSGEVSDSVFVRVRAAYYTDEALNRTNVCRLEHGENENGIGIYTPKSRLPGQDNKDKIRFDVTFTLPAGVGGEDALYIKKLATEAPLLVHEIAVLSDAVLYGTISSNTAHFPFNFQRPTNMAIYADVDLFSGEGVDPTALIMTIINTPVDSRVSLTTALGSGGKFRVDAKTVNAPLSLSYGYVDSPLDSQLNCEASTLNAPATVHLHSAFEGSFTIGSSIIGPSLEQHRVEDPAGEGRERLITTSRGTGRIQGSVRWVGVEHSESGLGSVQVSTALSPARLIL